MQKMYPRTNPEPAGPNSTVIPAPQIEEAIRESVRENAAHNRHESENTSQVVTDVNSLVQRVADVSLDQLDDGLWTYGSYEISCTARANEYKGKSPAICSSTTLQSTQREVSSIRSRNGKRRRIVPRAPPSEAISWARRFHRRRPRRSAKMFLSRRNDLSPVVGGVRGGTGPHFAQHAAESRLRESRNSVAPRSPAALSTAQAWTVV